MRRIHAVLLGLVLPLTGCGGGSGDSGIRPSAPEYPLSAVTARQFGGLAAPTFTAAQIDAHDDAISASADTLLLSDDLYFNGNAETVDDFLHRRTVECIGGTCYFAATTTTGIQAVTIQELADEPSSPNERTMPVGQRHGVALAQATDHGTLDPSEHYSASGYGGWLDHSAFGFVGAEYFGGELDNWGNLYSISFGQASNSSPTGNATWTGIVTGVDISLTESVGNVVQGQARINFDLEGDGLPTVRGPVYFPTVDIAFTQMYDLDARIRRSDIRWSRVRVENGSFSAIGLDGRFYGPSHEEIGGVFEASNILGAFGATQE